MRVATPELARDEAPAPQPSEQPIWEQIDPDELAEILALADLYEQRLVQDGPQNDKELHSWVRHHLGIDLPTVPVCEGHTSPFHFLADLYFERVGSALAMASRGGGKTFIVAVLHYLNSMYKPGCESLTFGADLAQAKRCYQHLRSWLTEGTSDDDGDKDLFKSFVKGEPQISQTEWKNGSKVEIVAGSKGAVNGPHPQKAHADEVELMKDEVWTESRHMAQSKPSKATGKMIRSQNILTSTRKGPRGRMQSLLDEVKAAKESGMLPKYEVYIWCIFEIAAQVENCQVALGIDPTECEHCKFGEEVECAHHCNCHKVHSGYWDKEQTKQRLLVHICKGKFHRSRGWMPKDDIDQKFQEAGKDDWEAQQECSKPATGNLYVPEWTDEIHTLTSFEPDPANGQIYQGIDWGGDAPFAVLWVQLLDRDVEAINGAGNTITLKQDTLVLFDEIYKANIGNTQLAHIVVSMENRYRDRWGPTWRPAARYPDPALPSARADWAAHNPPLKCEFKGTRDKKEHIKYVRELFDDKRFYAHVRCRNFIGEVRVWTRDPKAKPDKNGDLPELEEYNHAMAAWRYLLASLHVEHRNRMKRRRAKNAPPAKARGEHRSAANPGNEQRSPVASRPRREAGPNGQRAPRDSWRRRLGSPVTR